MNRRGACRAGVLDPRGGLPAQPVDPVHHKRGTEILRRETTVVEAEIDGIDIARIHLRVLQRLRRDVHNQGLDGIVLKLAELRMMPTDDACRHNASILSVTRRRGPSAPLSLNSVGAFYQAGGRETKSSPQQDAVTGRKC